ncbi:three-helix bundle dimerization domain-containing protein [Blastococcus sp. LR1]|uniref:arsenate reductase/protein-tyrosine-phosphatase family protein n=1 Tax=Blastococcus sp. LR1 TaxID=2877000 RepID=UPI001CCB0A3F|nr:arsenate reductase ArsC [Blastococcus sp. LR1]MCA0146685.1 arsenate reductase ArsC [Blastococcus sp. LR1]
MTTEKPLPGLLTPEASLHRLADDLAARFAGVFARETIDRYVFESYTALGRTAKVTAHLPVLAGHFTTERLTALAQAKGALSSDVCEVLFVCVQNAGRSQMAAGLLQLHGAGRVHVRSAGSQPAPAIDDAVAQVMAEVGIDLAVEFPKPLTDDVVRAADVVVTMGCGDACPVYPGKRYLDWQVRDPAGLSVGEVRAIRDDIDTRVRALLAELQPTPA